MHIVNAHKKKKKAKELYYSTKKYLTKVEDR